jgi:putative ABC transport system substrate-binding protein
MRRREFIRLFGSTAAAWPLAASAQQPQMPVIGFLGASSPNVYAIRLGVFREGLKEAGYIEDHNVAIVYRWADDHYDRLPALATELVQRRVAVLAASGSPAAAPAKAATSDIPIVFMIGSDPVQLGLVSSLNHPGGNLTGVSYFNEEIAPKRLNLLHELIPRANTIALLINPANATAATAQTREMQGAVDALGLRLIVVNASNPIELEDAFATLVQQRIEALQLGVDPLFGNHVDQIVALATRSKIPTIYP